MNSVVTFIFLVSVINITYCQIPSESVKNLYDTILNEYDTRIRPQKDQNITTEFTADFMLSMLVGLDTTTQKLSISTHIYFTWKDEFLVWNASEYNGKNSVQLKIDKVWHPTIKIGTSHDGKSVVGHDNDKVVVYSSGQVVWSTEEQFNLVCNIDISYYPFDTQDCSFFMFLSDEVSTDVLLTFDKSRNNTSQLKTENGEWQIISFQTTDRFLHGQGISLLNYRLKLQRRTQFLLLTTVLPLMLMFVLNTFVLLVPVCSGEKGSIAMTFLLSFSVYISSINTYLPTNSLQAPIALIIMIIMLVQSSLVLLAVVEESRLYHYGDIQSIRKSLLYRFICCRRVKPLVKLEQEDKKEENEQRSPSDSDVFKCVDRVLFYFAIVVNVVIILTFAVFL